MNLYKKKGWVQTNVEEESNEKFKFLLSMLDFFDKRKLQFSGQFYAGLLFEGARLGGLEKRIASLISMSKTDPSQLDVHIGLDEIDRKAKRPVSWIEILEKYSQYRDSLDEIDLPAVRVKTTEREIRQVLVAERGVSYAQRRERRSKSQTAATR